MSKRLVLLVVLVSVLTVTTLVIAQDEEVAVDPSLLTDPFLQMPTEDSVSVVWFTEFEGESHFVTVNDATFDAETMMLSRVAEDGNSRHAEQTENGQVYEALTPRDIWRHEAVVTGLQAGERVPYTVTSIADDGTEIISDEFTLQPLPAQGQPLQILMTSDHQTRQMTNANLQMVEETLGELDAVFFAGDLINIPDRASEWFDDNRGYAFFPALQGNGNTTLERTRTEDGVTITTQTTYEGGEIIQNAHLLPVVGNHEVMGRYNLGNGLNDQYNDPQPRDVAEARYEEIADIVNPEGDPAIREQWIIDNSFNTITYEEIFTLPDDSPGGETYWSMQYGDVFVIGLFATRIWRFWCTENGRCKYAEDGKALNTPENWGYGDFIFEDFGIGSEQYDWLTEVIASDAFQNAEYKVVLMHQSAHGVGDNYNPPMAHPQQFITYDEAGRITQVRYEYPIEDDLYVRDLQPLFEENGVNLVHTGHSHLWFRMLENGINYMETSNIGNTFGCYVGGRTRSNVPDNPDLYNMDNYAATGDPHGLEPIVPNIFAPQQDEDGNDLPCVSSNDLTVFTVINTETGTVDSYVFDTRDPFSEPQMFDSYPLVADEE
ncbi:MAG: metallophosphoesterase [Chloroflexota bacterium]